MIYRWHLRTAQPWIPLRTQWPSLRFYCVNNLVGWERVKGFPIHLAATFALLRTSKSIWFRVIVAMHNYHNVFMKWIGVLVQWFPIWWVETQDRVLLTAVEKTMQIVNNKVQVSIDKIDSFHIFCCWRQMPSNIGRREHETTLDIFSICKVITVHIVWSVQFLVIHFSVWFEGCFYLPLLVSPIDVQCKSKPVENHQHPVCWQQQIIFRHWSTLKFWAILFSFRLVERKHIQVFILHYIFVYVDLNYNTYQ